MLKLNTAGKLIKMQKLYSIKYGMMIMNGE